MTKQARAEQWQPNQPTEVLQRPLASDTNFAGVLDRYDKVYQHDKHGKADVIRPGYFNAFRTELRVGTVIDCRLGDPADGITQVFLQVIECRKDGTGDSDPVMVSVGPSRKYTPCRHDGGPVEADEANPEAA